MPGQHLVNRTILDLTTPDEASARGLLHAFDDLWKRDGVPRLNEACDAVSGHDQVHRLDQLVVDLGVISISELANRFPALFAQRLREALARAVGHGTIIRPDGEEPAGVKTHGAPAETQRSGLRSPVSDLPTPLETVPVPEAEGGSHFEAFHHFLQTGVLPWWAGSPSPLQWKRNLAELMKEHRSRLLELAPQLMTRNRVLRRLIHQADDPFLSEMLNGLSPVSAARLMPQRNKPGHVTPFLPALMRIFTHIDPPQHTARRRLEIWLGAFYAVNNHQEGHAPALFALVMDHLVSAFRVTPQQMIQTLRSAAQSSQEPLVLNLLGSYRKEEPDPESRVEQKKQEPRQILEDHPTDPVSKRAASPEEAVETPVVPDRPEIPSDPGDSPRENRPDRSHRAQPEENAGTVQSSTSVEDVRESHASHINPMNDTDDLITHSAGLITLWPYVARFFENTGLTQDDQFTDAAAAERAVLLLQYLADPQPEYPEYQLTLNKILCGLDPFEPVALTFQPTEEETQAAEALLNAAITNWPMLKNPSVDGFRRAFLQRPGVLKPGENGWILHVERRGYDIIRDNIPYGLSVITLPWMNGLLSVNW